MNKQTLAFGFHPDRLEIDIRDIAVRTLPNREADIADLRGLASVEDDWVYAPPQPSLDIFTGVEHEKSYSARVFGLPKTHTITHRNADGEDHLSFHLWSLSFFNGLRLTATDAGFLDATPLKPGKLVDFVPLGDSLTASVDLAERFWVNNRRKIHQPRRFAAAVHALFLAQYPRALEFEEFLYLYTALDACFALAVEMHSPRRRIFHPERTDWLCQQFNMDVPAWAASNDPNRAELADIRNDAVHEALYMGEPFGFAVHGLGTAQNLTLELRALICRFLVALLGGNSTDYVRSAVNTRGLHGLDLT